MDDILGQGFSARLFDWAREVAPRQSFAELLETVISALASGGNRMRFRVALPCLVECCVRLFQDAERLDEGPARDEAISRANAAADLLVYRICGKLRAQNKFSLGLAAWIAGPVREPSEHETASPMELLLLCCKYPCHHDGGMYMPVMRAITLMGRIHTLGALDIPHSERFLDEARAALRRAPFGGVSGPIVVKVEVSLEILDRIQSATPAPVSAAV